MLATGSVQLEGVRPEVADVMKREAFLTSAGAWGLKALAKIPKHTNVVIEQVRSNIVCVTWKLAAILRSLVERNGSLSLNLLAFSTRTKSMNLEIR